MPAPPSRGPILARWHRCRRRAAPATSRRRPRRRGRRAGDRLPSPLRRADARPRWPSRTQAARMGGDSGPARGRRAPTRPRPPARPARVPGRRSPPHVSPTRHPPIGRWGRDGPTARRRRTGGPAGVSGPPTPTSGVAILASPPPPAVGFTTLFAAGSDARSRCSRWPGSGRWRGSGFGDTRRGGGPPHPARAPSSGATPAGDRSDTVAARRQRLAGTRHGPPEVAPGWARRPNRRRRPCHRRPRHVAGQLRPSRLQCQNANRSIEALRLEDGNGGG